MKSYTLRLRRAGIQLQRVLAAFRPARVVAVEQPLAGLDRELLLLRADARVNRDAVRDAMAVGDDQRRSGIRFRLDERLERVLVLRAHRHAGDVDVAVAHGDQAEIFLARRFAAGGEFRDRAARRGFAHLAAGVGINFRVHDQHVDLVAAGEDVIQAAVADVVGPAVAAENPHALFHELVGQRQQQLGFRRIQLRQFLLSTPPRVRAGRKCPPRRSGRR